MEPLIDTRVSVVILIDVFLNEMLLLFSQNVYKLANLDLLAHLNTSSFTSRRQSYKRKLVFKKVLISLKFLTLI